MGHARAAEDRPHRLPLAGEAFHRSRRRVLYVPADQVLEIAAKADAIPYDIPGVEYGHVDELCSFDAFIGKHQLTDPALQQLAIIVRGADTARLDLAPQCPGLLAMSLGLSHNFPDDHEMLQHGLVMYDALYAWLQHAQGERHTWNYPS